MTKAIRSPAFVIRAFNAEVARVQDQTKDPQTAAMRLQFWQDSLNSLYSNNPSPTNINANPITQELHKVCCEKYEIFSTLCPQIEKFKDAINF